MINPVTTADPQTYAARLQQQVQNQSTTNSDPQNRTSARPAGARQTDPAAQERARLQPQLDTAPGDVNLQNAQSPAESSARRAGGQTPQPSTAEPASPTARQLQQAYQPQQNQSEQQLTNVSLDLRA